jgi:integrase
MEIMRLTGSVLRGNQHTYFDFQKWANLLVRVPKDSDKKPEIRNMSREAAADYNETLPPKRRYITLTEKTIDTSYLSPLRMIFKDMAAEHQFVYPLSDVEVRISPNATQSKERIPFDVEKLNTWFAAAAAEPTADKQWLPLLGSITGARIGELVFLQGKDVYEMQAKNGKRYWVLDLQTPIVVGEEEKKRQIKNPGSRRLIALHEVFEEVGFLDYVRMRGDEEWIFPAAHYDPRKKKPTEDPADAASKRMNRMLKGLGIHEEQTQVFHSTRHSAKELMRLAKVEKRTHDKQTGHAFADQSDQYGSKKLVAEELEVLASLPLPEGLVLTPYLNAKARRGRQ